MNARNVPRRPKDQRRPRQQQVRLTAVSPTLKAKIKEAQKERKKDADL